MATFENISSFSLVKLKPVLMERLGMDVLFLFFSGVVLLVILLTMTIFPSEEKTNHWQEQNMCEDVVLFLSYEE